MKRLVFAVIALCAAGSLVLGFVAWRSGLPAPLSPIPERASPQSGDEPPVPVSPSPLRPAAVNHAGPTDAELFAAYQCAECGTAAIEDDPSVAESAAEARWMKQNAFPTRDQRAWTDRASLAEVEARAILEGGDMWSLELARKRCATGDSLQCARDEIGRVLGIAEDGGRLYAYHVLAESHAALAEADESALPLAVIHSARESAPRFLFIAALRGDRKAEYTLEVLSRRLRRPWSTAELQRAFFAAASEHEYEIAHARATGRVPRSWTPRPSLSIDQTVRMRIDWEARTRAAHAAPSPAKP